ncbi:MAG TPA: DUF5818 domain-containing protein [Terriglobales bacterium]|nr:DUF5818 domain-containing protein [Terriglobales bacterium]
MRKQTQSLWILAALATVLVAVPLFAQQSDTQSANSPSSQPQHEDPGQAQPPANQNGNDSQAQSSDKTQTFSGTIMKSGSKYVLQDASGKTYDIDRQDGLKEYEGKQVRVTGTLDPDGKTIHMK